MAKGIVVIGGAENHLDNTLFESSDPNSTAIELIDTHNNRVTNTRIFIGDSVQKIQELQEIVLNIQDNTINEKTGQAFKNDILSKLPELARQDNEGMISSKSVFDAITLLSSWFSIKAGLAPVLSPFVIYLASLGS